MSDENLIRQLTASLKCEVCGKYYAEDSISIMGHEEEVWLLQVCCNACHSQRMLAALVEEESEEPTSDTIFDLSETEVEKFQEYIITADDVLDMFNFLSGFKGNINQLFDQI